MSGLNIRRIAAVAAITAMGIAMNACAGLAGIGGTSWKEEVLLHDGSKLIVERHMVRKGRHEPGRKPPVGEQSIEFTLPDTNTPLTWRDEYSDDLGSANFNLIALHILNGTPYVVTTNYGCLSYNKWGRPNPPYVIYKHDGKAWRRIAIAELPSEFKTSNLLIGPSNEESRLKQRGIVSAKEIEKLNQGYSQTDRAILREPLPVDKYGCPEMVPDGRSGWLGIDWFRDVPNLDACLKVCELKNMAPGYCPCDRLFKGQ